MTYKLASKKTQYARVETQIPDNAHTFSIVFSCFMAPFLIFYKAAYSSGDVTSYAELAKRTSFRTRHTSRGGGDQVVRSLDN